MLPMSLCAFMAAKKPQWVQEELRRRGLRSTEVKHGQLSMGKGTQTIKEEGIHHALRKAVEVNNGNRQDDIAFVALLKACTIQRDLSKGSKLHADIHDKGLLQKNIYIGNTLVNMYAKCGA
eukprot:c20127_g3_i1 orf=2-361(-)